MLVRAWTAGIRAERKPVAPYGSLGRGRTDVAESVLAGAAAGVHGPEDEEDGEEMSMCAQKRAVRMVGSIEQACRA